MIEVEQRRIALELAESGSHGSSNTHAHEKTLVYGYLGHILNAVDLGSVRDNVYKEKFQSIRSLMRHVEEALTYSIQETSFMTPAVREALMRHSEDLLLSRGHGRISADVASYHISNGVGTAMQVEAITLHTIKQRAKRIGRVSYGALLASQRVPARLAMFRLEELPESTLTLHRIKPYVPWSPYVFTEAAASYSPDSGLRLDMEHLNNWVWVDEPDDEPHIGCPAMLVPGFVRGVHELVSDLAVETGVMQVSD